MGVKSQGEARSLLDIIGEKKYASDEEHVPSSPDPEIGRRIY